MYPILKVLAYVPFYLGGAVAVWSLSRDLPQLWAAFKELTDA